MFSFEEPDSYIWNMQTPCNTSVSLQHINCLMAFSIKVAFLMILLKICFIEKQWCKEVCLCSRTGPEAPGSMGKKNERTVIQCDVKVIKKSNAMLRI